MGATPADTTSTGSAPETSEEASSEDRLLRAATDLFSDVGYEATRTRDISTRAGMSPAALYVHFPSKEELLFRLILRSTERSLAIVTDAVEAHTEPVDRIRALVREFSKVHATKYQRARIAQYERRHLTPEHREAVSEIRRQIRLVTLRELQAGIDRGDFLVDDPRVAGLAIMSLCADICRWYRPDGEFTPDELGNINADLVLRILRVPGY
ncbi:TetR/AcrR family transcriptional regulator [Rhodococcus triatomae]|uniref:DNA-binding transcriptional regulator, AcrR family n=1 Tax=Rhodococcus triatomae TaxID=300028 RepID=A0A1G8L960_9NOCA|nr:TetR/AcrR family transcriptional regulator [Rhodococcus triatomae]QNG20537.1 TetR/AcrR family transcriptional regulator [Rhodococcus triatomae]QNG23545.1 TetR/AcrR family transcriptional regulator [Rhodococcus triatomae]SDI52186.1 DNA-binding transcriptional regulator, AcrR family [Rhodococcus triatomae]